MWTRWLRAFGTGTSWMTADLRTAAHAARRMTDPAKPRHRRGILLAIIAVGTLLFAPADWVARAAEETPVPRVFVHYSRASEQGRQVAAEVALYLAGRGYEVADIREIPFAVSAARVRYFFRLGPGASRTDRCPCRPIPEQGDGRKRARPDPGLHSLPAAAGARQHRGVDRVGDRVPDETIGASRLHRIGTTGGTQALTTGWPNSR